MDEEAVVKIGSCSEDEAVHTPPEFLCGHSGAHPPDAGSGGEAHRRKGRAVPGRAASANSLR